MRGDWAALLEHQHMATRPSRSYRPDDPRTLPTTQPDRATSRQLLRQRRREILADTAARLLAGEDPDSQVMPMLYRTLAAERIIDASLGFIVTELDEAMTLGFIKGFPEEMVQRCLRLDFGQAICGLVAQNRTPMHVSDIQRTLDPRADLVRSAGITAYACEPLVVGNRILGTLSFASRTRRGFDAEDILFFRAIAKHVAKARDRVRSSRV